MTTKAPSPPLLYREEEMIHCVEAQFLGGEASVFSNRCPGREGANEDSAALIPFNESSGILVVADGVGGQRMGAAASGLAVALLAEALSRAAAEDRELRSAILDGVEEANKAVSALGVGAGTTLAISEITEHQIRPFHVGDSKVLVVGQRGRLKLETVSHSPTDYAVEAGFLDAEEALQHDQRHIISNMVGSHDMRIEVGSTTSLALRDTVVLASDGLFDNLTVDEVVELIRKGPLNEAAGHLARECAKRMNDHGSSQPGKPDDLTFVLFRRMVGPRGRAKAGRSS